RAGAPGGRAAEEGDGALGGDAVVVPGPAHAALVKIDRLAGEWWPAPAVVGDVLGLLEVVVLGEVLLGPRRAAVVRQPVGLGILQRLGPVVGLDGRDGEEIHREHQKAKHHDVTEDDRHDLFHGEASRESDCRAEVYGATGDLSIKL